jgi:hypothetical protein
MLIILNIPSQNDGVSLKLFQAKCTLLKLNGKLAKVQDCTGTLYSAYCTRVPGTLKAKTFHHVTKREPCIIAPNYISS